MQLAPLSSPGNVSGWQCVTASQLQGSFFNPEFGLMTLLSFPRYPYFGVTNLPIPAIRWFELLVQLCRNQRDNLLCQHLARRSLQVSFMWLKGKTGHFVRRLKARGKFENKKKNKNFCIQYKKSFGSFIVYYGARLLSSKIHYTVDNLPFILSM